MKKVNVKDAPMYYEKLKPEIKEILQSIGVDKIKQYGKMLVKNGGYKNFEVKFLFDIYYRGVRSIRFHKLLEKYGITSGNDEMIHTLMKSAFKELGISVNEADYKTTTDAWEPFGKEDYEKIKSKLPAIKGMKISKRMSDDNQPYGIKNVAKKIGVDMWDLLGALEYLCHLGKAVETPDGLYVVNKNLTIDSTMNDSVASDIVKEIKQQYPQVKYNVFSKIKKDYNIKITNVIFSNYPGEKASGFDNDPRTKVEDNWERFLTHLCEKYTKNNPKWNNKKDWFSVASNSLVLSEYQNKTTDSVFTKDELNNIHKLHDAFTKKEK